MVEILLRHSGPILSCTTVKSLVEVRFSEKIVYSIYSVIPRIFKTLFYKVICDFMTCVSADIYHYFYCTGRKKCVKYCETEICPMLQAAIRFS